MVCICVESAMRDPPLVLMLYRRVRHSSCLALDFLTLKDVTNFEGHYRFRSIGRYVGEQGILPCICVILYNVGRESR